MHEIRCNGDVSFWFRDAGLGAATDALAAPTSADVAIVGGGLTGLWTAYYLQQARPDWDIVLLESETVGYGASGRNGGWLSYGMPGMNRLYAASHGKDAVIAFQREIFSAIDEVVAVTEHEQIDAGVAHEGEIAIATNPPQEARLREELEYSLEWGFTPDEIELVQGPELGRRFAHLEGGTLGLFSRHAARVQPAKLCRGLRDVLLSRGVRIHEHTRVTDITPHRVTTATGHTVDARWVVRGTEAFTRDLPGQRRTWLPKLSSVIATEPLTPAQLDAINWSDNAVLTRDAAHSFCYIQKTADDRIVLGGPSTPYYFGSGRDHHGAATAESVAALRAGFDRLFPSLPDVAFDHVWAGVLGVPRDWSATVDVDRETGLCVAGGYVGDGLSATNLAARTLRDLLLEEDTEITRLPWVGKKVRKWEPEPARWLAVKGLYGVYMAADARERTSTEPRTSALARVANRVTGRY
ncbi:FAD-dependent oxidoreductase [Nocardioides sp. GY 10127]|uniref:NAD(P)/FAD-dependent oxidoreductase n=1 Tax=Nocardioides sp. GY 10127 TaxID=2569762 RepID=UPI0010A89800|nr:FAD-dependent oxidoreductase [Nocardioides sp. GY 10127]TIC85635.1 FAD-dependent oxidoreductase [Nocardioides sp. GY 10127]